MKIKNTKIHMAIIILGSIFIIISAFHSNMWFDETYSVAIANHPMGEIWNIGGNDVHPILYYFALRILNIIFGNNIIIYRLFSVLPVILMSIVGFTHIRKDFGKKTGIIFSFLSLFLPMMATYAVEIRMYTWAMFITVITAIYVYRIINQEYKLKNFIIFGIFSLMGAYTHYYGLMFSGIINLLLFVWILRKNKKYLKIFLIISLVQVSLYLPWLINFIGQLKNVSHGFWIGFTFPDTIYELLTVQYAGILDRKIIAIFPIILYIYFIVKVIINKRKKYLPLNKKSKMTLENIEEQKSMKSANIALIIYIVIIIMALIVSSFLHTLILYYRYLIVISGLLIFFIAEFLAREKNKFVTITFCIIILIIATINNYSLIKKNYDSNNYDAIKYVEDNIQDKDIIIYKNAINGSIFAIKFPNNKQYFWDSEKWNVEEAYRAYGPQMATIQELSIALDNYTGRIWVIDSQDLSMYSEYFKNVNDYKILDNKTFYMTYQDYTYNLVLLEKVR